MKKAKKKSNNNKVTAIFRSPNKDPKLKYFKSLADIHALLGSVPLCLTEIEGSMYIITRADAKKNGELRNMYHNISNGEIYYNRDFYGDVVITGYNPKNDKITSLTTAQINRIMNAPRG